MGRTLRNILRGTVLAGTPATLVGAILAGSVMFGDMNKKDSAGREYATAPKQKIEQVEENEFTEGTRRRVYTDKPVKKKLDDYTQTVEGVPKGVAISSSDTRLGYGEDGPHFAVVLDCDGRNVLVSVPSATNRDLAEAKALVRAEINDGDEEPIKAKGIYEKYKEKIENPLTENESKYTHPKKRFNAINMKVDGYEVNFPNDIFENYWTN